MCTYTYHTHHISHAHHTYHTHITPRMYTLHIHTQDPSRCVIPHLLIPHTPHSHTHTALRSHLLSLSCTPTGSLYSEVKVLGYPFLVHRLPAQPWCPNGQDSGPPALCLWALSGAQWSPSRLHHDPPTLRLSPACKFTHPRHHPFLLFAVSLRNVFVTYKNWYVSYTVPGLSFLVCKTVM